MAKSKFYEPYEDTKDLFREIIRNRGLDDAIKIKVLADNKQKDIGKVVKANALMKHMTNEDVIVIINEEVFERLDHGSQYVIAENILTGIHYDPAKEKVEVKKPTVNTYKGVISKHSIETFLKATELVDLAYQQIKEEKKEAKQNA